MKRKMDVCGERQQAAGATPDSARLRTQHAYACHGLVFVGSVSKFVDWSCRSTVGLPVDRLVSRRSTQLDRSAYRTAGSSEHRQSHARPLMWARAGSRGSTCDARPSGGRWMLGQLQEARCAAIRAAECTIASGQGGGRGTTADNWRSVLTCSSWFTVMVLSVVV